MLNYYRILGVEPEQDRHYQWLEKEHTRVKPVMYKKRKRKTAGDETMRCPKCGGENCQVITEMHTEGTDYSVSKGCCGWLLAGPPGVLCGFCTGGKQAKTEAYWICNSCGKKWKA